MLRVHCYLSLYNFDFLWYNEFKETFSILAYYISICCVQLIAAIEGENGQRYIPISYVPGAGSVIIQAQPTGTLKQMQPSTSQQTSPNKQQLQLSPKQQQSLPLQAVVNKDKKPKRTGSLGLFFRKVTIKWQLVSVSLCMCFVGKAGHMDLYLCMSTCPVFILW